MNGALLKHAVMTVILKDTGGGEEKLKAES